MTRRTDNAIPPTIRQFGLAMTDVLQKKVHSQNRMNATFYEDQFEEVEQALLAADAVRLGEFIPDEHPDGAKGITYGQVGARKLDRKGNIRYLQVINIRDTGIDFAIKPDRVAEGSHNDPPRSRIQVGDVLFTNTAFRGTETLLGRCVVIHRDYGPINISQDIDRIRVAGISPYYVGVFLKTQCARILIQRVVHGVDSQKINFGHVRNLLIVKPPREVQTEVESQYKLMSKCHDRAMAIKERLLEEAGIEPGQFGEEINSLAEDKSAYRRAMTEAKDRLDHLVEQVELIVAGERKRVAPFPD